MPLLLQRPTQEMRASTGLHTNQMNLPIGHEVQQLFARKLLAYHNLSAKAKADQMKNRLAKINAIVCSSMGYLLRTPFIPILFGSGGGPSH